MKKYNFDEIVDRYGTDCLKYDGMKLYYPKGDYIPMWVADMDFKVPDEIINALHNKVDQGIYGYNIKPASYWQAIFDFYDRHHNLKMDRKHVFYTYGVVSAIHFSLLSMSNINDNITIMSPVYGPFATAIQSTGRKILRNPLLYKNGVWTIDYEDLDKKLSQSKMMILCSPHNPVGRVWTKEELEKIATLCIKNNVIVISDEIHNDLIMPGHKHIPFCNISDEIAQRTIMLLSPSKTFNVAGLLAGTAYIPNDDLYKKFFTQAVSLSIYMTNTFTIAGAKAAYEYGDEWLEQVIDYIYKNYLWIKAYFAKELPKAIISDLQGTYLLWIDFKYVSDDEKVLKELIETKGLVAGEVGSGFGEEGKGFYRLNLACPKSTVEEVAKRMVNVLKDK